MKKILYSTLAVSILFGANQLNATPLDELIKDIDVSGFVRYRYYEAGQSKNKIGFRNGDFLGNLNNYHSFRTLINFKAEIDDEFVVVTRLNHSSSGANTIKPFTVWQIYLQYLGLENNLIELGRFSLNTIWGDSDLTGTGARITNTSIDGLSLSASVIDSLNVDNFKGVLGAEYGVQNGAIVKPNLTLNRADFDVFSLYYKNMYIAQALYDKKFEFGDFHTGLWLNEINDTGLLYGLNLVLNTNLSEDINYNLNVLYLGNALTNRFKNGFLNGTQGANGSFVSAKGTLKGYGFDASIGGVHFGKKDKYTFNILEDWGDIDNLDGLEIYYTEGSNLMGDVGRNTFVSANLGYTIDKVRVGGEVVYGFTETSKDFRTKTGLVGGEKYELVGKIDYKYSPKLNLQLRGSYLEVDSKQNLQNLKNKGQAHLPLDFKHFIDFS